MLFTRDLTKTFVNVMTECQRMDKKNMTHKMKSATCISEKLTLKEAALLQIKVISYNKISNSI